MVERYYRDPEPISPITPEYNKEDADPRVLNYTKQLREKMHGVDVRESLARTAEITSIVAKEANVTAEEAIAITQSLLDGTFDDAELATAIKEKMNQLEKDYAPQLAQNSERLNRVERNPFYENKASFAYVDDDGAEEVMTILKPMFDSFGAKITMAIVTDWIDNSGYLTQEQLSQLYDEGHDVVSHTKSHENLSTISESEIINQLSQSKNVLNEWGYNVEHLAYPYGSNSATQEVIKVVKRYYKSAMYGRNARNIKPMHSYLIKRIDIAWSDHTLEDYKRHVDGAIENGELLVLLGHVADLSSERIQMLEDVISYIYDSGYEVERYRDAYEKHGNTMEVGDYSSANPEHTIAIGANGVVSMSGAFLTNKRIITAPTDAFTNENLPSDFTSDAITINVVRGAYADGLPTGRGGTLSTYNLTGSEFCFQEYRPFNRNNTWTRRWTGSAWTNWEQEEIHIRASNNQFLNDNVPSDFEPRKITTNVVKGAYADGFPHNRGGIFTTYNLDNDYTFCYQTYQLYDTSALYRRRWGGESWTEWVNTTPVIVSGVDEYSFDSPISDFEIGIITHTEIKGAQAGDFPTGRGGILSTVNLSNDPVFAYQEYKPVGNNTMYRRYWNSNGYWSQFSPSDS